MAGKRKAITISPATAPAHKKEKSESANDEWSPKTLSLTSIIDDCLLLIFDYLELGDLLNVAEASKRLLPAAVSTYKRKYGKIEVRVKTLNLTQPNIWVKESKIFANGFPLCLKFLRCFGLLINQLKVSYFTSGRKYRAVLDQYIGEFCAATVIKIDGDEKRENVPNLSKCFPNVQHLELRNCVTSNLTHTAGHLPNLKDLLISNSNPMHDSHQIPTNIILSNPKLTHLRLHWNVSLNLLRAVSEHLEELESLDIIIETWNDSETSEILKFKNVKKLRFGLFCILTMPNVNMLFERLKDFTLGDLGAYFRDSSTLLNFIGKHPQITKFKCEASEFRRDPIFKTQIVKLLPSLEELDLRVIDFEVEEAINMLKKFAKLQVFQFTLTGNFNVFQERLSEGWRSTIDNNSLVELQR